MRQTKSLVMSNKTTNRLPCRNEFWYIQLMEFAVVMLFHIFFLNQIRLAQMLCIWGNRSSISTTDSFRIQIFSLKRCAQSAFVKSLHVTETVSEMCTVTQCDTAVAATFSLAHHTKYEKTNKIRTRSIENKFYDFSFVVWIFLVLSQSVSVQCICSGKNVSWRKEIAWPLACLCAYSNLNSFARTHTIHTNTSVHVTYTLSAETEKKYWRKVQSARKNCTHDTEYTLNVKCHSYIRRDREKSSDWNVTELQEEWNKSILCPAVSAFDTLNELFINTSVNGRHQQQQLVVAFSFSNNEKNIEKYVQSDTNNTEKQTSTKHFFHLFNFLTSHNFFHAEFNETD